MTAPISNEPTTTRLHHYAGHYCLLVGVSAKKFALRTKNGPKLAFYGVLGELFRENTAGWVVLGELFRG